MTDVSTNSTNTGMTLRIQAVLAVGVMYKTPRPAIISCVMMTKRRAWACGPLPCIQLGFEISGGVRYTIFRRLHVRDMDGLVVCAVDRHRHRQGFEPRFPRPSRGPLARSPPLPPSTSRSTIGAASGWVVCLLVIFFFFYAMHHPKKPRHHTCSSVLRHLLRRPTAGASPRGTLPLPRWGSNRQLQGGQRYLYRYLYRLWHQYLGFSQADSTGSHWRF